MGQGVDGLPVLGRKNSECDWSKVKTEYVAPDENVRRQRAWGNMSTGGSRSVRGSQEVLRKAGAAAREMLLAAAGMRWGVPAAECRAHNSVITHVPSGRTLRFGEIAAAATHIRPPTEVKLKEPSEWTLLGTPQGRLDVTDKVLGRTIYGIDVRVPDMLYAAAIQAPVFGARLKSVDESGKRGMSGVRKVVALDNAVAVIAEDWWRAKKAVEALRLDWDLGKNGSVSTDGIAAIAARPCGGRCRGRTPRGDSRRRSRR
jgi:isoquinoline 1-oxidoreductase beta subunit